MYFSDVEIIYPFDDIFGIYIYDLITISVLKMPQPTEDGKD